MRGRIRIVQKDFAADLMLTQEHLCRIMRELRDEGRIKKVGKHDWVIRPPEDFPAQPEPAAEAPSPAHRGVPAWG